DGHEAELVRLREETGRIWEEIARLREDMNRLREDMIAGFRRHDEEIAKLREDMKEGFERMDRHISALGARWGLMSEEAFREGLKGILEKEFGAKVERWAGNDGEGIVYGYPSRVEVDIAIRDDKVILMEVMSHARASDVAAFWRKALAYERATGRKPSRLVIVTPYADGSAVEACLRRGIELYTKV
ncbi:MAG: DUF3782 domain-containing protein, partial [Candidatus Bathyarchaeia archaeon]